MTSANYDAVRGVVKSGTVLATLVETESGTIGNDATELHTNSNAASITNEANATTGFTAANNAVLSSVASPVSEGSYAISIESNTTPTNLAGGYTDLAVAPFNLVNGDTFKITFDVRHNGTGGDWLIFIATNPTAGNATTFVTLSSSDTTYVSYEANFVYGSDFRFFGGLETGGTNDGGIYIDNLSITKTNNVISNGEFYNETTSKDWTPGTGWSIGSGVASVNAAGVVTLDQEITFPEAGTYEIGCEVTAISAGNIGISYTAGTAIVTAETGASIDATGFVRRKIYVHAAGTFTVKISAVSGTVATVDNVTCYPIEDDISASNDNGLEWHGQLTRTAVATGAGTMAFSGFSADNYLEQPYTSALDDDFTFECWVFFNSLSGTQTFFRKGDTANTESYLMYLTNNGDIALATRQSSSNSVVNANGAATINTWDHYVGTRGASGTALKIYKNGQLLESATVTARTLTQDEPLIIGNAAHNYNNYLDGSIAIIKVTDSELTAAQIKTNYNTEKHLFKQYAVHQVVGESYSFDMEGDVLQPTTTIDADISRSLNNTAESEIYAEYEDWDINLNDLVRTNGDVSQIKEFLLSCGGGATAFTFDPYGTVASPNETFTAYLESVKAPNQRKGTSERFQVALKVRVHEG